MGRRFKMALASIMAAPLVAERVSLRNLIRRFDAPVVSPDKNRSMFVFGEIAPEAGKTSIARRKRA